MNTEDNITAVRESFGRCILKPEFFDDFYETFMTSAPEIAGHFANINIAQQKQFLREDISFLILFANQKKSGELAIEKIGGIGGNTSLDIQPSLYKFWTRSLLESIRKHDHRYGEEIARAWEIVLEPGIKRLTELQGTK